MKIAAPKKRASVIHYIGSSPKLAKATAWNPKHNCVVTTLPDGVDLGWDGCGLCRRPPKECTCRKGVHIPYHVEGMWSRTVAVMATRAAERYASRIAVAAADASRAPSPHPDVDGGHTKPGAGRMGGSFVRRGGDKQ